MGPKPAKIAVDDDNSWRTRIEEAILDDDTWKVKVIIFENSGSEQDHIYLNKFETFAAEEKRFVIKNICKTETIFMVNQLGAEKKVKDENLRVFEEGQAFLKEKKDIPPENLALIIKQLILKIKDEYLFIKKQKLEVKEGLRQESATMINREEVRGSVSLPPANPPPVIPPKGKGKEPENVVPEPVEGKKYNTVLRERGEEWRDRVYVDDFPLDGPNIYVAVTGFMEPLLPHCMIRIGIPLTAVVQIRIDTDPMRVPSSLAKQTKRGQSQTEILTEKYAKFWEDVQELRIINNTAEDLKDTAFIIFRPPYRQSANLSGDPDVIYDEICYLMYDVQDLSRQHLHFLDNMEIIQIPEDKLDKFYFTIYNRYIEDLPLECVTVYSVLDSILQTACKENLYENSLTSVSTEESFKESLDKENENIQKAKRFVREVFKTLCNTDTDKKSYRLTYGEEYENHKDPVIIKYGDFIKYPTFHLKNINLENIVGSTLFGMPLHMLWLNQKPLEDETYAKISFHVNMLLLCFDRDDIETAELTRLLQLLACRKLYNNRSSLKKVHIQSTTLQEFKKIYLKRSILAEPLTQCHSLQTSYSATSPSFPSMTRSENQSSISKEEERESSEPDRIKLLFTCPDISELVSAAEIANDQPISHMIDEFEFFEDFTGIRALQVLLDAFNKFNCVDYKYCEVTDAFILMFFNSHNREGIAREEWRSHLSTPICLQDFFDYVLDEHYEWIQNEEKIYDEGNNMKRKYDGKVVIDPFAAISCIENTNVEMDLLMEGSLKHQETLEVEESAHEMTDKETILGSKKASSPISIDNDSKSSKSKKQSPDPASSKKQVNRSSIHADAMTDISDICKVPFSGYDLGDRRVEVFGKDATYFSRDRTRVSTFYTLLIPHNIEYIMLNVVPGDGNNEFWIHRVIGDNLAPEVFDKCQSFRVNSKDHVMMNIMKQTYKVPLSLSTMSLENKIERSVKDIGKISTNKENKSQLELESNQPQYTTKSFYSFCITWPNGLITESVHDNGAPEISHIKQYRLTPLPHLDEDSRCISLNGEVVIFKTTGEIEVFRPDGTYILITKFGKILHIPEIEQIVSDKTSIKSDKTKEKPKGKEKKTKEPVVEIPEHKEKPPPEYEIVIEEFEIIESSGLKQKWVGNASFDIEKVLIRTATDFCLGEIFSRRLDGTNILLNKDGVQIVTFPDKTRIITYYIVDSEEIFPEWTDEEIEFFETLEPIRTSSKKSASSMTHKSYATSSYASTLSKKLTEEEIHGTEESDGYISVHIIYTIEHANFTTVTINKGNGDITIDSPNNTSLTVDTYNHYQLMLDEGTSATYDSENLHISYEACPECKSYTTCNVKINQKFPKDPNDDYVMTEPDWVKLKDSFCKKVMIDNEGNISLLDEPCSQETSGPVLNNPETLVPGLNNDETSGPVLNNEEIPGPVVSNEEISGLPLNHENDSKVDWKSESSFTSHGRCREMYQAKNIRFMVLNRDLTCSELVHRAVLEQYKKACRWQPWCSMNQYDTFGDFRTLHTILTPVNFTESEKWLMNSKMCAKPTNLTYKDLKKDGGKGFYEWMRPYKRFVPQSIQPDPAVTPTLPKAFILRTVEQQWGEKERERLKGGKELLSAILRYRHMIESESESLLHLPVVDIRDDHQRHTDEILQTLAHRIYRDLKEQLAEDVQSRAKADITTKPKPPVPAEEMTIEEETEPMGPEDPTKRLEEERASLVKEVEDAVPISSNLAKYWRRRAEELKSEEFYLFLLREGSVPKYFLNLLGGAIWWEINNLTGDAITTAQRRKQKCVCAEGGEGSSRDAETSKTFT